MAMAITAARIATAMIISISEKPLRMVTGPPGR